MLNSEERKSRWRQITQGKAELRVNFSKRHSPLPAKGKRFNQQELIQWIEQPPQTSQRKESAPLATKVSEALTLTSPPPKSSYKTQRPNGAQEFNDWFEKVKGRLMKERLNSHINLCLFDLSLEEIPETIGHTTLQFDRLVVYNNSLKALPRSIGKLTKLHTLSAFNNQLETLPEEYRHLASLSSLNIDGNRFAELPSWIGELSNLKYLYVSQNQLSSLSSLENLSSLKDLEASHNQLTSVGELRCSELSSLLLNNNLLTELPSSIGNLSELRVLNVSHNQLSSLPSSLSNLLLQRLDLSNNQFTTIPECLYQLPRTCEVILEGNPLSQDEINRLNARTNAQNYSGPRFYFSMPEAFLKSKDRFSLDCCLKDYAENGELNSFLELPKKQQNNLANWLGRLKEVAKEKETHENIKKILHWLAKLEIDSESAIQVFSILKEATATCGDRVILSLNNVYTIMKISEAGELNLNDLKKLIIGLSRLRMLDEISRKKCSSLNAVDEVEVYLHFQTELKDRFELPLLAENMLYKACSRVTDEEIEKAFNDIQNQTQAVMQLDLLIKDPSWKKAIEKDPSFAEIKENCEKQKNIFIEANEDREMEVFKEFTTQDNTAWNPYYIFTKKFLSL